MTYTDEKIEEMSRDACTCHLDGICYGHLYLQYKQWFLSEKKLVKEQQATISRLEKEVEELTETMNRMGQGAGEG